MSIFNDSYFN
jgi:hypothetical protein